MSISHIQLKSLETIWHVHLIGNCQTCLLLQLFIYIEHLKRNHHVCSINRFVLIKFVEIFNCQGNWQCQSLIMGIIIETSRCVQFDIEYRIIAYSFDRLSMFGKAKVWLWKNMLQWSSKQYLKNWDEIGKHLIWFVFSIFWHLKPFPCGIYASSNWIARRLIWDIRRLTLTDTFRADSWLVLYFFVKMNSTASSLRFHYVLFQHSGRMLFDWSVNLSRLITQIRRLKFDCLLSQYIFTKVRNLAWNVRQNIVYAMIWISVHISNLCRHLHLPKHR